MSDWQIHFTNLVFAVRVNHRQRERAPSHGVQQAATTTMETTTTTTTTKLTTTTSTTTTTTTTTSTTSATTTSEIPSKATKPKIITTAATITKPAENLLKQ